MILGDDPRFHDPDKARAWLEAQRWPHGPSCPHCGNINQTRITALQGKAHRRGLYQCKECCDQFTVTVGTVMHQSRVPLNKWVLAMHVMSASAEHVSVRRLQGMLGITYQSTWTLCNRLRKAGGRLERLTNESNGTQLELFENRPNGFRNS